MRFEHFRGSGRLGVIFGVLSPFDFFGCFWTTRKLDALNFRHSGRFELFERFGRLSVVIFVGVLRNFDVLNVLSVLSFWVFLAHVFGKLQFGCSERLGYYV